MAKDKHPGWVLQQLKEYGYPAGTAVILYYNPSDRYWYARRHSEKVTQPNSRQQMHLQKMFRDISKQCLVAYYLVEEKANKKEFHLPYNWVGKLIGGNMLAESVGWNTPRFILADDYFLSVIPLQEPIWVGFDRRGQLVGLAFTPPAPWRYTQLALRVWLKISYHGITVKKILGDVIQIPVPKGDGKTDIRSSLEKLPPELKEKAEEWLNQHYGSLNKSVEGYFAPFIIRDLRTSTIKFGYERIAFRQMSGGIATVWLDLVGAKGQDWCPAKSKPSIQLTANIPTRKLDKVGEEIVERLKKYKREERRRRLSEPINRERDLLTHAEWKAENPDKIKAIHHRHYKKLRSDPVRWAKRLKYQNDYRRKRYHTDPAYRQKMKEKAKKQKQKKRLRKPT